MWRRQRATRHILGTKGTILTWTWVHVSSAAYKHLTPYPVALIELETGERTYGQLVDYEDVDIHIGQQVVATLRILKKTKPEDIVAYGVTFRVLASA